MERLEPLVYGESRYLERDAWVGLLAETGVVRGRSSQQRHGGISFPAGRRDVVEAGREPARLLRG